MAQLESFVNSYIYSEIQLDCLFYARSIHKERNKTYFRRRVRHPLPRSILAITLNNLLGNKEYVFIAIAPRSTLAWSGST